ncbi:MAG: hypothetical protein HY884_00625 [Deltaproteobacteria bacterium]|nr:hypothetical protein [Deltaproteobacteria bacterium]
MFLTAVVAAWAAAAIGVTGQALAESGGRPSGFDGQEMQGGQYPQKGRGRPDDGMRGGGAPNDEARRRKMDEVGERIEKIRAKRLVTDLGFDEKTAGKLSSILNAFDKERMEFQRERVSIMRLVRESKGALDDKAAAETLAKIEKNEASLESIRGKRNAAVKKLLTPSQTLRLMVFEREFEREVRRIIMDARDSDSERREGSREFGGNGGGQGRPQKDRDNSRRSMDGPPTDEDSGYGGYNRGQ